MLRKIERDVKRFRQIVRGVVKKDFWHVREVPESNAVIKRFLGKGL